MWFRKNIKKEAMITLRKNYMQTFLVCLVMTIFVNSYFYSVTINNQVDNPIFNFKSISNSDIVHNLLIGISENFTNKSNESKTNFATRGVLANIFNNVTSSRSFLFGILNSLNQFLFQDRIMASIIILIGSIITLLYWIFIKNTLRVGECRFFLENKLYENTKANRILYPFKVKRVWNISVIMLLKNIYEFFWFFTIIGGFVKTYSFKMVPYILAENPDINRKDVFKLSSIMMKGNKWKSFLLDISFIFWQFLSLMTFGIAGFLFVKPYINATNVQLYKILRDKVLSDDISLSKSLTDYYLFSEPEMLSCDPKSDFCGCYPVHLGPLTQSPGHKWITIDYNRSYSMRSLILLFFIYSMVGWVWEVILGLFMIGTFANRGVLFGPWLPIYGTGGTFILIILKRWIDKPILLYAMVVTVCAVVEYVTAWYLETFIGLKWWDYNGYLFNLHGRICLEGLLVFGIGGYASIYFFSPLLDDMIRKIPKRTQLLLCGFLLILFLTDLLFSYNNPNQGMGITEDIAEIVAYIHFK